MNRHPVLPAGLGRLVSQVVNGILKGQVNNQILITFRDGQTTTTVLDPRLGSESNMHLTPLTANAVTAKGTAWISARGTGTMTWTHANSANADQDFQGTIFS